MKAFQHESGLIAANGHPGTEAHRLNQTTQSEKGDIFCILILIKWKDQWLHIMETKVDGSNYGLA